MQMKISPAFEVALVVGLTFAAFDAHAQSDRPTALEMAQMPKFCYAQYGVPNATGDEFRIRDCGFLANHYCPGLMYLIRAKATGNKRRRMELLQHASIDIRGTENAIKEYPNCSIREHVAASKAEVLNLQRVYVGQPSGAK